MNKEERMKAVKCMEFLARQINNEDIFMRWLYAGVADGDIEYGDIEVTKDDMENLSYYIEDDNFEYLMTLFLNLMKDSHKNGGLFCDGIVTG